MIAHLSIGVRELERSKRFYDSALAPLGYRCLRPGKTMLGYGYGSDNIAFWIVSAERPVPADEKSGLHICFVAPSAQAVDAFHAAALRAGGRTTVRPVRARSTAPTITRHSSSIRMDTGSRRITARPKHRWTQVRSN
jgi:catechol 2,3-dioxygenase-like lactoylglutathione lyase family enzyme